MNTYFDNNNSARYLALAGFILAAALTRLLPAPDIRPWNFSPMTALALFGAAMLPGRYASMIVPVAAMLVSDIGLELLNGTGFHGLMPVIYGCFMVISLAGTQLRRFERKILPALGFAAGGSVFFFAASNLAVWFIGYPLTMEGLIACFVAALPFFQNSLAGDVLYTGVLFGGFDLAERGFPALAVQQRK